MTQHWFMNRLARKHFGPALLPVAATRIAVKPPQEPGRRAHHGAQAWAPGAAAVGRAAQGAAARWRRERGGGQGE